MTDLLAKHDPATDVFKRIVIDEPSGCWIWQGARSGFGYGQVTLDRKTAYVHRIVCAAVNGSIPLGRQVDHLCFNRLCCNPAHLEAVTPAENTRRAKERGGHPASCKHGHAYTLENTYKYRNRRSCRTCIQRRNQEHQDRKAAKL